MKTPESFASPVYVTRPYLPDFDRACERLAPVWESAHLTNDGPQHDLLEREIEGVVHGTPAALVSSGTAALQLAFAALALEGEVITTPLTAPATAHAIAWSGMQPVFCDIEPERCTLDPERIERAVTPRTSAIVPVHVYGMPCFMDEIEAVAARHGLRVVYDAAHAFALEVDGVSVAGRGDASAYSFHATKVFHAVEGGAVTSRHADVVERVRLLRNFGIVDESTVAFTGVNAKMNELEAVMGLLGLEAIDEQLRQRGRCDAVYRERLAELPGIELLREPAGVRRNYAYMPIRVVEQGFGIDRDRLHRGLQGFNVFARHYFSPLCSWMPGHREHASASPSNLPIAEHVAREVLCLPLFGALAEEDAHRICDMIEWIGETAC